MGSKDTMTTTILDAHRQWATRPSDQRFTSLESLRESVANRRIRARSVDIPLREVCAHQDGTDIVINSGTSPTRPNHWSFSQLCRSVQAPSAYLAALPTELAVKCLNDGLQRNGDNVSKLMSLRDDDGRDATLAAVTSPTYGRIWDADVVDAVQRIVERTGGRFHNPLAYPQGRMEGNPIPPGLYASDRDVFMFMIDGGIRLEAGPRAQLNRGFFVSNSEVGAATFKLTTFLFNEVCGNHIVWGAKDVRELSIRHTSGGPARFDAQAAPALMDYVNASAKPIESAIQRAQQYVLPADKDEKRQWFKSRGFTLGQADYAIAYAIREEGQCSTLWDAVQGVTASAREIEWMDTRIELETKGGKLLDLVSAE